MDGCMRSGQRLANHPSEWRSKVLRRNETRKQRGRGGARVPSSLCPAFTTHLASTSPTKHSPLCLPA